MTDVTDMTDPSPPPAGYGLHLSRRLFEARGRPLLASLGLLDKCAAGCIGGTSQNAGLDDAASRDHAWGPYFTFIFPDDADFQANVARVREALADVPDEADGVPRVDSSRRTGVVSAVPFLRGLTGLAEPPATAADWLPHLHRESFLGRRWHERLFDAGQGEVFHDPGGRFTALWRRWTAYVPPDIHRALLARALFRVWNASPEYNLTRLHGRGDWLAYDLCLARFVDEVIQLAFIWHERYVPYYKWRIAHFRRLPYVPTPIRDGLATLLTNPDRAAHLPIATAVVEAIKSLLLDLYHPDVGPDARLAWFAHRVRASIQDDTVRQFASLDW